MDSTDEPRYRDLRPTDLDAATALNTEAGWNQVREDWQLMLETGHGTAVEIADRRIVATSMVLPWGDRFAWIAMILVTTAWRRRGIASALMGRAIERCRAANRIAGLDATEAGHPVYVPLGFEDIYTLSRWTGEAPGGDPGREGVAVVAADGVAAVAAYDAPVFGADRARFLGHLRARCPGLALTVREGDRVRGYVLARDGRLATQVGPLVADDAQTARALLGAALARAEGPVFLDALDRHDWIGERLTALGFTRQRGYTRMLLGRSEPLDDPSRTYVISGPEFG